MIEETKHDCEWYQQLLPKYVSKDSSLAEAERKEIDSHLENGCSDCMRLYATWIQARSLE